MDNAMSFFFVVLIYGIPACIFILWYWKKKHRKTDVTMDFFDDWVGGVDPKKSEMPKPPTETAQAQQDGERPF